MEQKFSCDKCPYKIGCSQVIDATSDNDPLCDGVVWWLNVRHENRISQESAGGKS